MTALFQTLFGFAGEPFGQAAWAAVETLTTGAAALWPTKGDH
jgi:hypothetical protein